LSYPQTNVFLVCYSIHGRWLFENVKTKWFPEVERHCKDTYTILCGTKVDLKKDEEQKKRMKERRERFVSKYRGMRMAEKRLCCRIVLRMPMNLELYCLCMYMDTVLRFI